MYFFKDDQLAEDLKANIVTEREQMIYLLCLWVFMALFTSYSLSVFIYSSADPEALTMFDYAIDVVLMFLSVVSVLGAFFINQKGDATDFLSRFLCLSFPIGIKVFIITLLAGSVAIYLDDPTFLASDVETEPAAGIYSVLSIVLVSVYTIWRYITCFKIASGQG